MILEATKNNVQVQNLETQNFKIKASAKSFEILSANLYSNKLGAMIRELSTNAYDAHVENNCANRPFDITLPTPLNPTFKIRDYGKGLSEKDVMTIFTTFFESTKTDSNDFVGCLGLGSKTPFGISKTFTINSYYNNKKSIYSAFIDENGVPSITKFGEFDSTEESGLEIEVPISDEYLNAIENEIKYQLKFFKVKPNIINADIEWLNIEADIKGKDWIITKKNLDNSYVVQGQIAYPIDVYAIRDYISKEDAYEIQYTFSSNIIFFAEIGDVNIAPSREALTYDKRTIEYLIERAKKFKKEFKKEIYKKLNSIENEFDRAAEIQRLNNKFNFKIFNDEELKNCLIKIENEYIDSAYEYYYDNYNYKFRKNRIAKWTGIYEFSPYGIKRNKKAIIYIDKNKRIININKRLEKFYKENNYNELLLIYATVGYDLIKSWFKGAEIINIEDLDYIKENKEKKLKRLYYYNYYNWFNSYDTYKDIIELEGYYIDADNKKLNYNGIGIEIDNIDNLYGLGLKVGFIDKNVKVYRVSKKSGKGKLINFVDAMKEYLKNNKFEFLLKYNDSKIENIINYNSYEKYKILLKYNWFKKIYNLLESDIDKMYGSEYKTIKKLGLDEYLNLVDLEKVTEKIYEKYEMLKHVDVYAIEAIDRYIAMVDEFEKCKN